ncbi:sulfatase-like hydrolase/transferase [Lentisphaera profundi]|uniref:Sulfatase-like hydrolase/transferase n=1 Tax=Lentisphaera profundi TaxID=1658616 RepID=A0ABY7VX14_9BACT|nr:sulfatase-like hydrolase/transferase [Lentisphaera profundi]WDE98796.1 sulfatase-like hydrolase/transferase [Lentisphaera profundi]
MNKIISLLIFCICGAVFSEEKPNIIFIEVDDLPAHYVGVMGADFAQTPTLDTIADQGVLFTNAVCQGTMCGPSRNSLMAGVYPHNIGMYQNGPFKGLGADIWTLPKALQRAGYTTAHIGKSHLHPSKEGLTGTKEEIRTEGHRRLGFDYVWQSLGRAVVGGKEPEKGVDSYVDFLIDEGYFEQMKNDRGKATTLPDDIYLDGLFTKLSEKFISEQEDPYFLWLNYSVPHGPYDVKQAYHDRFEKTQIPKPNAMDDKGENIPSLLRPSPLKDFSKLESSQKGNCASIAFMDDQIKAILNAVELTGEKDNTIIVFFSDHGILVGEHGLHHKSTLYKEVLNPALVIYDPRQSQAKVVSAPVQLLDLLKTTLDWAGASDEDKAQPYGDSLMPLLTGQGEFNRDFAVGESPGYFAIVTEKYKYIAPFDYQKDGKIVLFDLTNDPDEIKNIADQNPELVAMFKEKAKKWLAESGEVLVQDAPPSKEEKRRKKAEKKAKEAKKKK